MAVGESVSNGTPGIPGKLPGVISALTSMGFLLGGPHIFPLPVGPKWSTRMKT